MLAITLDHVRSAGDHFKHSGYKQFESLLPVYLLLPDVLPPFSVLILLCTLTQFKDSFTNLLPSQDAGDSLVVNRSYVPSHSLVPDSLSLLATNVCENWTADSRNGGTHCQ